MGRAFGPCYLPRSGMGSGLWPLLFAPVWYGFGPLALARGVSIFSEGPKARRYTSLGQRPRIATRKQFKKGQRPAPSLMSHTAVLQRSGASMLIFAGPRSGELQSTDLLARVDTKRLSDLERGNRGSSQSFPAFKKPV